MEVIIQNGKNIMAHAKKHKIETQQGFSLMELLIVLVIVGLLAALVGPTLYQRISPAKATTAKTQIENFTKALDSYFVDTGEFPSEQVGLSALRTQPSGVDIWNGPYLKKEIPTDPWGNPYVYRTPGRSGGYEISSLGSDGKEGGKDDARDINSWESK
jgi:general secretion pathway protein G